MTRRSSLRLRLVRAVMRGVVKPLFARTRHAAPARFGLIFASLAFSPPLGVSYRRFGQRSTLIEVRPGVDPRPDYPVLVWFHGGAYVSGSVFTHRGLLGRLAKVSGLRVIGVGYRLAPEHPSPAAFDDAMAALSELGLPIGQIILGGDSAGGGIAAAVCAQLCAEGRPPAGMVLLSPWVDLTLSGESLSANARRDPLIPVAAMPNAVRQICGALDPADARISPLFANWLSPCPALLQVGTTEVLLDDSLRLAEVLRCAGSKVIVQRQPGAPHVLAFLAPWVPEAVAALTDIGLFIQALCRRPPTSDS